MTLSIRDTIINLLDGSPLQDIHEDYPQTFDHLVAALEAREQA